MARVPAWISSPSSNHTRNISDMHVPKVIKKRFAEPPLPANGICEACNSHFSQ